MNFWSLLLKILGWKIYGENLISPRSVIAVAPHTSYLDGVIGFIAMKAIKIRFQKVSLSKPIFFRRGIKYSEAAAYPSAVIRP